MEEYENPSSDVQIDPRLQDVVERMFQRCYDDGEFKQVFILEYIIFTYYRWLFYLRNLNHQLFFR